MKEIQKLYFRHENEENHEHFTNEDYDLFQNNKK